jgi:crossover junction endodeoxyribonuclease RuvC
MQVLGIDPGTACTGLALLRWDGSVGRVVELGYWRPSCTPWTERIRDLYDTVEVWLLTYGPDAVAVEAPFVHPRYPRSGLWVEHVVSVVLTAVVQNGYAWAEYPASVVRRSVTGTGNADKETVRRYLYALLPEARRWASMPDDAFDALAVAYCHALRAFDDWRMARR